MGKGWDDLGVGARQRVWHHEWLSGAMRALRPGGLIKAYNGSRTVHHMAMAMEEVGFVDVGLEPVAWGYGTGWPKGTSIGKQLDRMRGEKRGVIVERTMVQGGGNALQMRMGARREVEANITAPASADAKIWEGWNTALKPAWEPVIIGRKPSC